MNTITVQLAELFKHQHHTPGFIQGVATGNDCSHFKEHFFYLTIHFSHRCM